MTHPAEIKKRPLESTGAEGDAVNHAIQWELYMQDVMIHPLQQINLLPLMEHHSQESVQF